MSSTIFFPPRYTALLTTLAWMLFSGLADVRVARADSDGFMRGQVTSGGIGIPGVLVQVRAAGSQPNIGFGWIVDVVTDANGSWVAPIRRTDDPKRRLLYSVNFVKAGHTFNNPGVVTVAVGDANNINGTVRTGPISGRVLAPNGDPIADVRMTLILPNPSTVDQMPLSPSQAAGTFNVADLDFANGSGAMFPGMPADNFGVIIKGTFTTLRGTFFPGVSTSHGFDLSSDDGSRLWIDGQLLINNDGLHSFATQSATRNLPAFRDLPLELWMFEAGGLAGLRLTMTGFEGLSFVTRVVRVNGTAQVYDFNNLANVTTDSQGAFSIPNVLGNGHSHVVTASRAGFTFVAPSVSFFAGQPGSLLFTVRSAPVTLAAVAPGPIAEDTPSAEIPIGVTGIPEVTLEVFSSNPSIFPERPENLRIIGTGSSRKLVVSPLPNANGQTIFTLRASNGFETKETTIPLTVEPRNDIPVAGATTGISFNPDKPAGTVSGNISGLATPNAAHTIEAWVKPSSAGLRELRARSGGQAFRMWPLVLGQSGRGAHHWLFKSSTPNEVLTQFGVWEGTQIADVPVPSDEWTHLAATWDPETRNYTLFRNGQQQQQVQATEGFQFSSFLLTLGASRLLAAGQFGFPGSMDEVRVWSRPLAGGEIRQNMTRPLIGTEAGLVLYWRLDEAEGLVAVDSASAPGAQGGRSDGVISDASYSVSAAGLGNGVLQFNGSNSFVNLSSLSPVIPTNEITIQFWQRARRAKDQSSISLSLDPPRNRISVQAPAADGAVNWAFGDPQSGGLLSYNPATDILGSWEHWTFVASQSGNFMAIYRNGVQEAFKTGMSPYTRGASTLRAGLGLDGEMDELRIWNVARTEAQILADARGPLAGDEPGLIAYYRFNEGRGTTAMDSALPAHNGLLANNPLWDPPNDSFGTLIMDEDNPKQLFLPGFDVELSRGEAGASLAYSIVVPPANGSLRHLPNGTPINSGSWTDPSQNPLWYVPNNDYTGPDSFTYVLRDSGGAESPRHTVLLYVAPLNDPPTITDIRNLVIEEDSESAPVPFVVADTESTPSQLILSVSSSEPTLIPPRIGPNVRFAGSGTNRTVQFIPAVGEIGTATIIVTVTDPAGDSDSTTFQVRVIPRPAYALIDLGALSGRPNSYGLALNDSTWAVGGSQSQSTDPKGVLYKGIGNNEPLVDLGNFGGLATIAYGINNTNVAVGFSTRPDGRREAFRWDAAGMTTLDTAGSGRASEARAINGAGVIVGAIGAGSPDRAFRWVSNTFTELPVPGGSLRSLASDVNEDGWIVGHVNRQSTNDIATIWDPQGNRTVVDPLQGDRQSRATAINASRQVVGWSQSATSLRRAILTDSPASPARALGVLPSANDSAAHDINDFGQVVGQSGNGPQSQKAFLFSAGRMIELNSIIHDHRDLQGADFAFVGSNWELTNAAAINREGAIVGAGTLNGNPRAFMAIPAWVIGRQIARPEGAVSRTPEIELLRWRPGDTPENSFFWSQSESKLYAIRPVTARLKWFTTITDTTGTGTNLVVNMDRIVQVGITAWPRTPTIHVATSPVEVEPQGVPFSYSFQEVRYSTRDGVNVEPSTKRFTVSTVGYSVLYYLKNDGFTPNPTVHRPAFDVVRTVLWDDPLHLVRQSWVVGNPIKFPTHFDYLGKNGHVLFEHAFYDGVGESRAYDRSSRLGPIIAVNKPTERTASLFDPLAIAWYHTNRLGVAWASTPVVYTLDWPANPPKIIIASGLGSAPIDRSQRAEPHVYNQPIRSLPGYNPNEEHAGIFPSSSGEGLFAVRNDINGVTGQSEPYALLKYRERTSGEWRVEVHRVVAEEHPYFFRYAGEAGKEIQPPFPLSVMTLCAASAGGPPPPGQAGMQWEDYNGKIYARGAGEFGGNIDLPVRWFYPLQQGYYYDLNVDGTNDLSVGSCVAWLDRRTAGSLLAAPNTTAGTPGTPIDVVYDIRWPDDPPILNIGETITDPRRGIKGVYGMADVQIVYDELSRQGESGALNLARMYDPISARTIPLPAGWVWPTSIPRQNIAGKEYFPKLPYALKLRLIHDPINKTLSFIGILDKAFGVGPNPLMLPNVMTPRERLRIRELAEGNIAWGQLIDSLYNLTRNPNQVDLDPRDGTPDADLRIGLITRISGNNKQIFIGPVTPGVSTNYTTNLITYSEPVGTNVVLEKFGDGPKALTAGLNGVPNAIPRPLKALSFNGSAGGVDLQPGIVLPSKFTQELWVFPQGSRTIAQGLVAGDPSTAPALQPPGLWVNERTRLLFGFGDGTRFRSESTPAVLTQNSWNHVAAVFDGDSYMIYVNGRLAHTSTNFAGANPAATPVRWIGRSDAILSGRIDEVRFWNIAKTQGEIRHDMSRRLNGAEDGLAACWRLDEGSGTVTRNAVASAANGNIVNPIWVDSTAPTGIPPRFITLAENNNPELPGLPVGLSIIRIDDGPYQGDLKVLPGDNVFDERVSMRHSSDFGGAPERLTFEWFYKPDSADFDPTLMPAEDPANGNIIDPKGWLAFPVQGNGVNDITLGEGNASGLLTLGDNWFICRYRGYGINGETNWSLWAGDPGGVGAPRAALVEGWIKRVIRGLNPFDARTADFHSAPSSTFASMLIQAGPRYEGPIAFNPSAENLNSVGLIEAYSTVLDRGKGLSIEGVPAVDFDPANNALLLVSSRIADLYTLLGNEAFADAEDPTIGFGTKSGEYGTLSPSIFAFQNQMDSLLQEELSLLRGRDDQNGAVRALPFYNRLIWNFTLGEGEVAYQQGYNISDQNFDGFIDEKDARIMYPQGHGDAWGHYLTAIKTYYELLRHPRFTWKPRTENVSVSQTAVEVDFLDERKFAKIAAQKAKAGRHILDLTYRANYVEDPEGQWQGYKDSESDRGWGVDDWGRRAGQAAYFDWVTANAILPSVDPNPDHKGIQKVDRITVTELTEITAQAHELQNKLDEADSGLNPLGLAKGAVPFDIDPTFLEVGSTAQIGRRAVQGLTQFDQILERAFKALKNTEAVWNQANKASALLRRNQDDRDDFSRNDREQEQNFKNRLIEIFGYPYGGDIGAGKTYPSGYDGPDLYHYMYVNRSTLTGENSPPSTTFTGFFSAPRAGLSSNDYWLGFSSVTLDTQVLPVLYPLSTAAYGFEAPASWGQRRAQGQLQAAISDMVQAQAQLKIALQNYDGLVQDIEAGIVLLQTQYDIGAEKLRLLRAQKTALTSANDALLAMKRAQLALSRINDTFTETTDNILDGVPKFTIAGLAVGGDLTAPIRGALRVGFLLTKLGFSISTDVLEGEQRAEELGKEGTTLQTGIDLEVESQKWEVIQRVKDLEHKIRDEAATRLAAYNQAEILQQAIARYYSKLAEGERLIAERIRYRKDVAAQTTEQRYQDMTFRIFRNDALQKYRSAFDLAARYVYFAANAYDYEINFLGTDQRSGRRFLTDIVRQRSIGELTDSDPVVGTRGLADPLARLSANWEVLKPRFGVIAPQIADTRFSLREELFRVRGRIRPDLGPDGVASTQEELDELARAEQANALSDARWREVLTRARVPNLWDVPEFRRYCRPFASEQLGRQPGIVVRFNTTITFGLNFFGWPLAGGDSAYDPTQFSTKIARAGVWFSDSDGAQISQTPRLYLVPVGMDVQRAPSGDTLETREWRILDQAIPAPFPIGASDLVDPKWIPMMNSVAGSFVDIRRYGSFPARHDSGAYSEQDLTNDTRLIGRSAWNTEWLLIIPGGTLLADPNEGLRALIESVSDIKLYFQTYSYSGD